MGSILLLSAISENEMINMYQVKQIIHMNLENKVNQENRMKQQQVFHLISADMSIETQDNC